MLKTPGFNLNHGKWGVPCTYSVMYYYKKYGWNGKSVEAVENGNGKRKEKEGRLFLERIFKI